MPAYNSFFGGYHSIKLNNNNLVMGTALFTFEPYPAIIPNPTIEQIFKNWNIADTGISLMVMLAFMTVNYRFNRRQPFVGPLQKRNTFVEYTFVIFVTSWLFGLRNSYYRLVGLVPNGLKKREVLEPLKYQYANINLKNSFLRWFIDPQPKQTA